jgi:hypothetical protein
MNKFVALVTSICARALQASFKGLTLVSTLLWKSSTFLSSNTLFPTVAEGVAGVDGSDAV